MVREITTDEVKKHHDRRSAWIIIHNKVYDVTSFLGEHPGGEQSLLEFAGKDGTKGFEDVGHSQDAREMLVKYKIGSLAPCDIIKKVHSCTSCCLTPKRSVDSQKSWRTFDGPPRSPAIGFCACFNWNIRLKQWEALGMVNRGLTKFLFYSSTDYVQDWKNIYRAIVDKSRYTSI